jgi:EmrB/QacA subfamily drug resistance transporter
MVAAVALGAMLAPLNSTMIAVALPRLTADLGADGATAAWLVTAYLIIMAALQPVGGKLGDRLGRRRLLLGGIAGFGLASLGAAFTASLPALIALRSLQAVAGALAFPNGVALLRDLIPAERRAGLAGLVGGAVGFAAAAGPALGGLLVSVGGWRAIFFANLALVVPALLIGWRAIPRSTRRSGAQPFDLAGAAMLSALLVALAGLLTVGRHAPHLAWAGGGALALATVLFVRFEVRQPDPALQPRLFRRPVFAAANASVALSNLAMYITLLVLPLALGREAGWSSAHVGLALALMSAGSVVLAPVGGRLADRRGRRLPTVAGMALLALGLLPLALGGTDAAPPLLVGLALAGAGLGLGSAGLQTSAVESVGAEEAGVAAGVFSTSRYLGSIVASSLLAGMMAPAGPGVLAVFALALAAAVGAALAALALPARPV